MAIKLETRRLLIRNFTLADAAALREIVLEKEAGEYAVYDYEWPTSEEAIEGLLVRFAGYDGFLAICLKETGRVTGFLSFDPSGEQARGGREARCSASAPPEFNLGYCLHPDFRRQGYVTEACTALFDYAFTTLGACRVSCGTAAVNAPSLGVIRRLGMRKVGEETVAFRQTPDGAPIAFTGFMFELRRDEWAARLPESPEPR